MKIIHHLLLVACLATEMPVLAAEPTPSAPATTIQTNTDQPPLATTATPEAATNAATTTLVPAPVPDLATNSLAGTNAVSGTNAVATANTAAPPVVMEFGTNGLRLNIHNAPLNLVLDYLSDAAGFVINKETEVRGTVDLQGKDLTKDEAVELLNSALKKNGCAVVRNGRILTIVAQDTAKISDTPIEVGNNAEEVVKGGEVVTQIIPVKYASVTQLVPNLELLLPTTATCTANESANTIILVATRTDIKRMLRIITALDTSIASVSSIKVIPLKYADAKDTATLITALFPAQAGNQGGGPGGAMGRGSIISMLTGGGLGGGGPGGRGGGAAGGGRGGAGGGGAAAAKVVAVGDDRSNSLVISAPADLVATVETMVKEIDQEVTDVTELRVFRLKNADPAETADQLATLFPDPTASTSGSQNNTPFFMRGQFGGGRGGATATAAGSERTKKMGRVMAVPDPRTSSIIVMASKTLMPQIEDMVTELDSDKGRKEVVGFYDLQNANPQDVQAALQDLFNRNTRVNNNNQNLLLGNNNPLNKRIQQSQQTTSGSSSGFGGGGRGSSMGGGF
ncbi:MAG: secretin N-terminal domain-containing protein [Verrucomicrobiota bacterium]